MESDEELLAAKMVRNFKQRFNLAFGTIPVVRYTLKTKTTIPLNLIEECANKVLNSLGAYYYDQGITTTYHDDNVLLCRWVYYKIAENSGYSRAEMAQQVKQTPQSVGYGLGKITKLIKNDRTEKDLYERVKKEIDTQIFRGLEATGDTNEGRADSGGSTTPA